MKLTPAQSQIAKSTKRFRVVNCGRRFGKTTLAVLEMVGVAVFNNDRRILYVAPTFQQARDIAWEQLKGVARDIATNINESRLEITIQTTKGGTSLISLRGWESVETIRGQKFDFVVLDEVATMRKFWVGWREVIRPTLTDNKGSALFISTPKGFNHFYDLYNTVDPDYESFHFTSYDNDNIPREEIDKARQELPEDEFHQEYMADFRKQVGLVYKEFNREKHIYRDEKPLNVIKKFAGIDFGFTNPTAVIQIEKDYDSNYWVFREWYKSNKTDSEIAEYVCMLGMQEVYPDPESPSAIAELQKKGVYCKEVVKNKDSIKNGINKVRALFLQGKLKIHYSCENLISELENYRYPDKRDDRNEEENPVKENDHACFTKDTKIEGDILYTKSTGFKDVYEFMNSKVTADHPYLTQRGFVRLDSLRYSDRIVIWKNKLLMELYLDDTRNQTGVSFVTILYLLQRNLQAIKQNVSIGIYGENIMAKYLKAFISIIKMVIQLIMKYLISNVYHLKNTIKSIIMKCYLSGVKVWQSHKKKLQSGTNQTKQKNFTKKLLSYLGLIKNYIQEIVINAKKNIKHHSQVEVNSATIIAKLEHYGKEEVFASVSKNGYFTANGVVVSNCDAMRYALMMEEPENIIQKLKMQDNIYRNREQRKHGYE